MLFLKRFRAIGHLLIFEVVIQLLNGLWNIYVIFIRTSIMFL